MEALGYKSIYSTPKQDEVAVIKSLLVAYDINFYVKNENFSALYGPADGLTSMEIMVRQDQWEEAVRLVEDFITPPKE